jgi:hypothetical protein
MEMAIQCSVANAPYTVGLLLQLQFDAARGSYKNGKVAKVNND